MTNDSFVEAFFPEFPAFRDMDRSGQMWSDYRFATVHDLDFYFYGVEAGDDGAILRRAEVFLAFLLEVERKYVESVNVRK